MQSLNFSAVRALPPKCKASKTTGNVAHRYTRDRRQNSAGQALKIRVRKYGS